MSSLTDSTQASIAAAVESGSLDLALSAGPIEAMLKVAEAIDHPDFPMADGRFDNVSMSLYLKYCAELHLTPASRKDLDQTGGESGGSKLGKLRSIHSA